MTDEHYRVINRAIAHLDPRGNAELQDLREDARTALHHIFGREKKLREELDLKDGLLNQAKGELDRLRKAPCDLHTELREENARLRKQHRQEQDHRIEAEDERDRLREERDAAILALLNGARHYYREALDKLAEGDAT